MKGEMTGVERREKQRLMSGSMADRWKRLDSDRANNGEDERTSGYKDARVCEG
jgi:hypothetical protein